MYEFFITSSNDTAKSDKVKVQKELYEQQPMGLYLGRFEKADSHIILTQDGTISYAHTVREEHMEIGKQRLFIQQLDDAPKPNANLQTIFDDTCIDPEYNIMKTVATRSVGSKQRFKALP